MQSSREGWRSQVFYRRIQSASPSHSRMLIYTSATPVVNRKSQSQESIDWNEDLHRAFESSKKTLSTSRVITIPRPDDQVWIVTDGTVRKPGVGAALYITRGEQLHISGVFSAKLRGHQSMWLPCEIEALAIATAIKHFSPYITQANKNTCVLTDSKPCVQAYRKLCRGEFSASPRVSTFLSAVSRYQATLQHVAGAAILPSDFASLNAPDCEDMACQICNFAKQADSSIVRRASTQDILSGTVKLPFNGRSAWKAIQSELLRPAPYPRAP